MGFLKTSILVILLSIFITKLPHLLKSNEPLPRQGFAAPKWKKVLDTFRELLDSRVEKGGSLAVFYKNKLVVDTYGGYADDEALIPYDKKTLTQLFSTTKGVAGVIVALLVDRGLLEYNKPVAKYWPEFAQHGKGKLTVEQLMSHQAGCVYIDEPFSHFDDIDTIGKALAKQKPHWTPGTKHGYHALTIGWLVDQLVRRVDPKKRTISQILSEDIVKPNGLDFYIGLPLEENHRCSRTYAPSILPDIFFAPSLWDVYWNLFTNKDALLTKSLANPTPPIQPMTLTNDPKMRATANPATQGFATAVSLASFFNMVINGQNGKPALLKKETVAKLQEPLVSGQDESMFINCTYGRGTQLIETPLGGYMFGTPGAGGQMGYADSKHNLAWAYVTNHHFIHLPPSDHPTYTKLLKAIYDTVKQLET